MLGLHCLSFIKNLDEGESAKVVGALAGLCRGLGLTVSAEGIGNLDQSASMLDSGIEQRQGEAFSRSIGPLEIQDFLRKQPMTGGAPSVTV